MPNLRLAKGFIVILLIVALLACQQQATPAPTAVPEVKTEQTPTPDPVPTPEPTPEPPRSWTTEATLVAVGDIMMHSPQITHAYDSKTNTYDFSGYFTEVKDWLAGDFVVGNLETPVAGEDIGGYAGYPMFNAPESLLDTLVDAGFNLLSTANNHSLDRREIGLLRTLENVRARGLVPFGTHASEEEAETVTIMERNDIRIAFLSYTYGTNGIPIPQGKDYLVNLIDEARIVRQIAQAKEEGADLVTVAMHWGHEYHRQPNAEQRRLAKVLSEAGADIILGHHPHVVQPLEWLETIRLDGSFQRTLVLYSLGNFISNQGPDQGTAKFTDVGAIVRIHIRKEHPDGILTITEVDPRTTWVHKYWHDGKRHYRLLPVSTVLASRNDAILTNAQYAMLEEYLTDMTAHMEPVTVPVSAE